MHRLCTPAQRARELFLFCHRFRPTLATQRASGMPKRNTYHAGDEKLLKLPWREPVCLRTRLRCLIRWSLTLTESGAFTASRDRGRCEHEGLHVRRCRVRQCRPPRQIGRGLCRCHGHSAAGKRLPLALGAVLKVAYLDYKTWQFEDWICRPVAAFDDEYVSSGETKHLVSDNCFSLASNNCFSQGTSYA
jgi:hypothetical protein